MFRAFLITYEWIQIYVSKIKMLRTILVLSMFIEIIMILGISKPLNSIFIFSLKTPTSFYANSI